MKSCPSGGKKRERRRENVDLGIVFLVGWLVGFLPFFWSLWLFFWFGLFFDSIWKETSVRFHILSLGSWDCSKNVLGVIQKHPGQLALGGPAWSGVLFLVISKGPFPPQPHCDSVACWSFHRADLDHVSLQLFNEGLSHCLLPWQCPLSWVRFQNDICESSLMGWDHVAFSRTLLECSSLTSAVTLCLQQQLNEPSRVAEKCVWTPTQGLGNYLAPGLWKHKRHRLSVRGLHIWLIPKMHVAQETCKAQTPSFQGKKKKNSEEYTRFETKIWVCIESGFYCTLYRYLTPIEVKSFGFYSSWFLILNSTFGGLGYEWYRQCFPSTTGLFPPQLYVKP